MLVYRQLTSHCSQLIAIFAFSFTRLVRILEIMVQLKTIRLPFSANLKLMLVLFALAIVAGTLWYTQRLVDELKSAERQTITFYANTFQTLLNTSTDYEAPVDVAADLAFQLTEILYFPVIVTEPDGSVMREITKDGNQGWGVMNVSVDTTLSTEEQEKELRALVQKMGERYPPLVIKSITEVDEEVPLGDSTIIRTVVDTTITNYLYFDDSDAVKQLQLLPWIEITIISMFILIAYISFSHIKRSEQSNIWVGMAKETAHQLGTPLSSLMGWIELLRFEPENRAQVLEATDEMSRDVDRLTTVAQRFSKIGSAAQTQTVDMNEVIGGVVRYFERRLPHLGKRVVLEFTPTHDPLYAQINVELFQWVFENLIRNAADAIEKKDGHIGFHTRKSRGMVIIDISDNGKGIDPKVRKDIFRPGFSTKQRGWGLGLSLAKRIVEEYHGGKIAIKESSSEGTTFTIRLKEAVETNEV